MSDRSWMIRVVMKFSSIVAFVLYDYVLLVFRSSSVSHKHTSPEVALNLLVCLCCPLRVRRKRRHRIVWSLCDCRLGVQCVSYVASLRVIFVIHQMSLSFVYIRYKIPHEDIIHTFSPRTLLGSTWYFSSCDSSIARNLAFLQSPQTFYDIWLGASSASLDCSIMRESCGTDRVQLTHLHLIITCQ